MASAGPPSGGHYFETDPAVTSRRGTVELSLPDLHLDLVTDRGVFSGTRVDPGTKLLLLEAPSPPSDGVVADVGCGYGPIAVALAKRAPGTSVWAVDVNARARALCATNAIGAGLDNVRVVAPDEIPADLTLDAVYSNPPIRIGKHALHALLGQWLRRLRPDGTAWLVVQKHLGADSLARWLESEGWATQRAAARAGYRLLEVRA